MFISSFRHRNKGVREIAKKNSEVEEHARSVVSKSTASAQMPTLKDKVGDWEGMSGLILAFNL